MKNPTGLLSFLWQLACSVRLGHATNSSSSHSIVLLPPGAPVPGDNRGKVAWGRLVDGNGEYREDDPGLPEVSPAVEEAEDLEFGWEWFTLSSVEEKRRYLWSMLYGQMSYQLGRNFRKGFAQRTPAAYAVAAEFTSHALEFYPRGRARSEDELSEDVLDRLADPEGYVDHQSTFSFPLDGTAERGESDLPYVPFIRWFRDLVLHDRVVIYGGNDNDEEPSDLYPLGVDPLPFPVHLTRDEYSHPAHIWDRGNHWLIYNRDTGSKLRIPMDPVGPPPAYASYPELVDLKVTDFCAANCAFCYQGSTTRGQHTTLSVAAIVEMLQGLQVLEVAIGGGEPLTWPNFWPLVEALHNVGITANVTTRRLDLISEEQAARLGGVGFSVETADAAREALRPFLVPLNADADDETTLMPEEWRSKLVLHVAFGTTPVEEVVKICRMAANLYLEVLLLDYKPVGRGASFPPYPYDHWVDAMTEFLPRVDLESSRPSRNYNAWHGPKLGVDTALAEKFGKQILEKLPSNRRLMSPGEGCFSLYIDAVDRTFSKDSYSPGPRYPLPQTAEGVLEQFRAWHGDDEG